MVLFYTEGGMKRDKNQWDTDTSGQAGGDPLSESDKRTPGEGGVGDVQKYQDAFQF